MCPGGGHMMWIKLVRKEKVEKKDTIEKAVKKVALKKVKERNKKLLEVFERERE